MQLADVIALSIDDVPGRAAEAVKKLSASGVNILYLYSFLWQGKGVLILRTDNSEKANETIIIHKMSFLTEADFA